MALTPKATITPSKDPASSPACWEERSARRVIETGRNQILERSRRIVDAAYQLLEQEGLDGLTIRAVLNRTGLSRRAFYERFEGKDDLMLAVFEHTILLAATRLGEVSGAVVDPLARLEQIITLITLGRSPAWGQDTQGDLLGPAMSREHLRLAESRPRHLQAALAPLIALIARQLSDGMASGVIRHDDPERLAVLIYNLVSTTVHTEWIARGAAAADRACRATLAADLWEFCRRAIIP